MTGVLYAAVAAAFVLGLVFLLTRGRRGAALDAQAVALDRRAAELAARATILDERATALARPKRPGSSGR